MKWIAGTIALLALGLAFKLSLLIYSMYVLLGVLLLNRVFTRVWTSGIEARRFNEDQALEIGQSIEVKVAARNTGRLAIPWLLLEDSLPLAALTQSPHHLKAEGARLAVARLEPGESKVFSYQVQFLMRGYYQLGPLLVETGDVFGLHRRFRVMTEPSFAQVPPRIVELEGYNLSSRRPIGEIRLAHRLFEDPTRLAGVRPYQKGDPLNRIHWRATARTGELQSRSYESSCVAGATFVLDFHGRSFAGPTAVQSAELAAVTVASLANAVCWMGQQMGLVSNGRDAADRIREEGWRADFLTRKDARARAAEPRQNTRLRPIVLEAAKGDHQLAEMLAVLARLEHTDGLDYADMLSEAASRISRDTTVVAVLGTVTQEIAVALGNVARRGWLVTAIVVSVEMEAVPDWARPPDWAAMLLAQGIDFRVINSEEAVAHLCAEAIIR